MPRVGDAGSEGEESVLSKGLVGRQRNAVHVAAGCADADAQPLKKHIVVRLEGSEEEPGSIIAMIADGGVTEAVVGHSVEHTHLVGDSVFDQVSSYLIADIAAWNQQGGKAALDEDWCRHPTADAPGPPEA